MGERWLATTEEHPQLVHMVEGVKKAYGDTVHGPFYINEYGQVIVPVGPEADYYLAGEYDRRLIFDFEGRRLSGDAVDLTGKRLQPGDEWEGPHPGIPYILKAGGRDVYYNARPRRNVTRQITLSSAIGPERAAAFARAIREIKGFEGGRFYVNEWRQMFAPVGQESGWRYLYLGELNLDDWFPKPMAERA
jgi:hypothetical protein